MGERAAQQMAGAEDQDAGQGQSRDACVDGLLQKKLSGFPQFSI